MSCDEVRDLIAAYSLGSASQEEREIVETHLASCDLHDELAETQAAALLLSNATPERQPPADLKARIMSEVRSGEPIEIGEAPPKQVAARRFRWLAGGYSIAAVLAIAVIGMVAWNVALQVGGDEENFVHFYREGDGDWLRVETVLGNAHAQVSLGGLDHLQEDQQYQLWAIRDDEPISIGLFNTSSEGRWAGDFGFAFFTGDRVAITVEQAGGSDAPTTDPVVSTRF